VDDVSESGSGRDEIDVDRLTDAATRLAGGHDIVVVPALPAAARPVPVVELSPSDASVEWFVGTAVAAGCRLLYVRRRTDELELAFSAEGVLHRWTARPRAEAAGAAGEPRALDARPANGGRSWSHDEQNAVVGRFAEGATVAQLATEFGRTTGGIRSRLRKLGLIEV
jgi:hypothetical protein